MKKFFTYALVVKADSVSAVIIGDTSFENTTNQKKNIKKNKAYSVPSKPYLFNMKKILKALLLKNFFNVNIKS